MNRGRGINGRDDRSSGIEIRIADALAKINPTDPFIYKKESLFAAELKKKGESRG
jgi:hypothetical protein